MKKQNSLVIYTFFLVVSFLIFVIVFSLFIKFKVDQGKKKETQAPPSLPTRQIILSPTPTIQKKPQVNLSFSTLRKVFNIGEEIIVEISANAQGSPLLAIDLYLRFDPLYLEFVDIAPGSIFAEPMEFSKHIDEQNGAIFYALGSPTLSQDQGALAKVTFKALKTINQTDLSFIKEKTIASVKGGEKGDVVLPSQISFKIN